MKWGGWKDGKLARSNRSAVHLKTDGKTNHERKQKLNEKCKPAEELLSVSHEIVEMRLWDPCRKTNRLELATEKVANSAYMPKSWVTLSQRLDGHIQELIAAILGFYTPLPFIRSLFSLYDFIFVEFHHRTKAPLGSPFQRYGNHPSGPTAVQTAAAPGSMPRHTQPETG